MAALITVHIPAYRQPEMVVRAVRSVLRQDYEPVEIIVTDDTLDNSVEKAVSRLQEPSLAYYRRKGPGAVADNWNEGVRHASGEYIKILHQDDWLDTDDALTCFCRRMEQPDRPALVFSACTMFSGGKKTADHVVGEHELELLRQNPSQLFSGNVIGAPSVVMVRRDCWQAFDPALQWLIDIDFYIRVLGKGPVGYIPEQLINIEIGDHQLTDVCINSPQIDVAEHFYLLNKLYGKGVRRIPDRYREISKVLKRQMIISFNHLRKMDIRIGFSPILACVVFFTVTRNRLKRLILRIGKGRLLNPSQTDEKR